MSSRNYPLNAWYVAAWDYEIKKNTMLSRTICEKKVVLFRKPDGSSVALEDACWHRLVPLSMGTLKDGTIKCRYHGLVFDAAGKCVHMPSQDTINPSACVRSFPLVERHRFAWIWMGQPHLADEDLIPDLHWNEHPDWTGDGGVIGLAATYELAIDNLMDLTHETFVHPESIGNDAIADAPFTVTHSSKEVTVTRWMEGIEPPAFWGAQLGKPGLVDRWQIIHFQAPSTVALDVGVAVAGTGAKEGDRRQGVNGFVLHTFTPTTGNNSLYFWSICRNYNLSSVRLTTEWRDAVKGIFAQDEDILEAQQRAMDANPNKVFYNLNIDAGGMWARRKIDEMIQAERETTSVVPLRFVSE